MRNSPFKTWATFLSIALFMCTFASGQQGFTFDPAVTISQEAPMVSGGASPGDAMAECEIVRLINTPSGVNNGRLVTVYTDANTTNHIWEPQGLEHQARDIFMRYSDDKGETWSLPVNLSGTANLYSAVSDWDGDGVADIYWGDSGKPSVSNFGNTIVVSWVDRYCPEADWAWGQVGLSTVQGAALYPNLAVYPNQREVPYAGVHLAISLDGGNTWTYGAGNPTLQLTYGRRDALQNVNKGAGMNWIMTWQEDPEGLQTEDGEGPETGASGAMASNGTDIWYTYTEDIAVNPTALVTNRTPLTNHSEYDLNGTNGFPMVGTAGELENHAATQANSQIINDAGSFKAIIAYEETKGVSGVLDGKTIQYHNFPFNLPVQNGPAAQAYGASGVRLTPTLENSTRVRFVMQGSSDNDPSIVIFWKQGLGAHDSPSDIMLKVADSLDPAAVVAARSVNLSTNTPTAIAANLNDGTQVDPIEDARAHCALLRNGTIIVGYSYTTNGLAAKYTDLTNYDFWMRRSVDGGLTWDPPRNLSNLPLSETVMEPRLVMPAKTGAQKDDAFIAAWGTETNVYGGVTSPVPLDIQVTRSLNLGSEFSPVTSIAMTPDAEFQPQLQVNDDVTEVYAVWGADNGAKIDAVYARGFGNNLCIDVLDEYTVPGGFGVLRFVAPGHGYCFYHAAASMGTSPGTTMPWGVVPLNVDALLLASLSRPDIFIGFSGLLNENGIQTGIVIIPPDPSLSGFSFWTAFVAFHPNWYEISGPALVTIK